MLRVLILSSLFVTLAVQAQDEPAPYKEARKPDGYARVVDMMQNRRTVKGADEAANIKDMKETAVYLVHPIANPDLYVPAPSKKPTELVPTPDDQTVAARISELDRFILKPTTTSKYSINHYDFSQEFGRALDLALRTELKSPLPLVRVNAARMLALAARSGATAHAALITELISNPATPPEILVYGLQAAGNLFAAADISRQGGLGTPEYGLHTISNAEAVKLVNALESVINRQTPYGPKKDKKEPEVKKEEPKKDDKAAGKKDEKAPPKIAKKDDKFGKEAGKIESAVSTLEDEEVALIRYIRRHAIRALAQVRYPSFHDVKANLTARPLFTLCRIATNDGPFIPKLSPEEYGDAVIGLCNLHSLKGADLDIVLNCIAIGTKNFAFMRSDYNIPWRGYGLKMNTAWIEWQRIFADNSGVVAKMQPLANTISTQILTPLEQGNRGGSSGVNIEGLVNWIQSRKVDTMTPYLDITDPAEKNKFTVKPVLASN